MLLPLLVVAVLLPVTAGLRQTTPFYDPDSWGTTYQAWCRFTCSDRVYPGQPVVLRFSDIVTDLSAFGNLRTIRGVGPGTVYLVETKYNMWPDRGYCMFQFRVQYPGSKLTGECGMDDSIVASTTQAPVLQQVILPSFRLPVTNRGRGIPVVFGLGRTVKYPVPHQVYPTTQRPGGVFPVGRPENLPFQVLPSTAARPPSSFPLAAWKNEPSRSVWRYHGRCTFVCLTPYRPGTLKVKVNVDKATANFQVYGKYTPLHPVSQVNKTWTVVNKSLVQSKYNLCQFYFTLDHFPQHPIPTGTCHKVD